MFIAPTTPPGETLPERMVIEWFDEGLDTDEFWARYGVDTDREVARGG